MIRRSVGHRLPLFSLSRSSRLAFQSCRRTGRDSCSKKLAPLSLLKRSSHGRAKGIRALEVEEEESDEEVEDLPEFEITTEEERLTAEYLASLDSKWTEDPPGHRSGDRTPDRRYRLIS